MYNGYMADFRFFHPVTIRYGDLDPQGHVNNAAFITYLEHTRVSYIRHLGLWDGVSALDIGFILARVEMDYREPIQLTDLIEVGVRVSRLGNKSLVMDYLIRERDGARVFAEGKTVQVTYDYQEKNTIPLKDSWKETIREFEGNLPA